MNAGNLPQVRNRQAGRLELRLRADRAFLDVASVGDVRFGCARAAVRLDGGPVDQVLRRYSHSFRATLAYSSRNGQTSPGHGHQGWDELEQEIGLSRSFLVELDPSADLDAVLDALRALPQVEEAGPQLLSGVPSVGTEPGEGDNTTFERVGAARALAMEPGDPTVIVAVIDSGVALDHPELAGRLRAGADTVDLVQALLASQVQLLEKPRRSVLDTTDELGHGTATCGIIGARGLRVPRGLGGIASVLPLRALTRAIIPGRREPTAVGAIPDINAAVKLAVDLGAKVLNLSFGTPESELRPEDPIPHAAVLEYATRRGAIAIAASGNRGDEIRYFPACLPQVIAVGSADATRHPSRFSTRGAHVALCAPGERVPCVDLRGYVQNTGTSFAAPFVAGAVALLVSRAHRAALPLDLDDCRDLLTKSAARFASPGVRGCGAGLLDVPAALRLLDEVARGPPERRLLSGLQGATRGWGHVPSTVITSHQEPSDGQLIP